MRYWNLFKKFISLNRYYFVWPWNQTLNITHNEYKYLLSIPHHVDSCYISSYLIGSYPFHLFVFSILFWGEGVEEVKFGKHCSGVCGWWMSDELLTPLHCSFPIHQFFILMTDTIAMQNRPHHTPHTTHTIFSLHQPPTTLASYFLSFPLAAFVLFHLSTQRGYAHAKGIKHIDFGRGSVCFLRKERDEKTLTWGCLTHSQVFPLTWMRDWECLFKYLSFLFTHLFFFYYFLTHTHPIPFL